MLYVTPFCERNKVKKRFFKTHRGFVILIAMAVSIILPFVMVNAFKAVIQTDNGVLIISVAGGAMLLEIISVIMFFANFFTWLIEKSNGKVKK